MSQNAKQIGQVLQRVAGIMTAVTVLATVIFTLLGVFGVVDMRAVQTEGPALAYVVAVGAFALSPLVAVGIVAVGLFNAIGIIAISAGGPGVRPPHRHRRGSEGHVHRGLLRPKSDGLRALAALVRQRRYVRLIRSAGPGASRQGSCW